MSCWRLTTLFANGIGNLYKDTYFFPFCAIPTVLSLNFAVAIEAVSIPQESRGVCLCKSHKVKKIQEELRRKFEIAQVS